MLIIRPLGNTDYDVTNSFYWFTVNGHNFHAYWIRISAKYTGASKSYLTHPYPFSGKDKNQES